MSEFTDWIKENVTQENITRVIVALVLIVVLCTIIFGDNSCSRPKRKHLKAGYEYCPKCDGTGYSSSIHKNVFGIFPFYENTECTKCYGDGIIPQWAY